MKPHSIPMGVNARFPEDRIREMFDRLAPRYDLFNRLVSLGMDRVWRRPVLAGLKPGMRVLDLGCGTGALSVQAHREIGGLAEVTGVDLSPRMVEEARKRVSRSGPSGQGALTFLVSAADQLPFEGESYDRVLSGFLLRNLGRAIDGTLEEVLRVLKRGGRYSFVDFTEPSSATARAAWRTYLSVAGDLWGLGLFGSDFPRGYLTRSAEDFLKPREFVERARKAGFQDVSALSLIHI